MIKARMLLKLKKPVCYLMLATSILLLGAVSAYTWEFVLQGTLGETFDDNINSSSDDKVYDFITNLIAGVGVEHEGKTFNFSVLAHVYQDIYARNSSLTNNSQDISVILDKEFTELTRLSIQNVFHHYPEPRTYENAFGLEGGRNTYYNNVTTCSLQTQPLRVFQLGATYVYGITEYQNDTLIDSSYHTAGGTLGFHWSSANYTYASYLYTYTMYDTGEKIPLHTGFLGHTLYFTRQLYANAHAGFDYTVTAEGPTYSPNILVSLIDDVDENNQLNLTFTYGLNMNPYLDEVFENWNISLHFTRQVLDRLSFGLITFYGQGRYRDSGIRSSLLGLTTNLSYEMKEDIFCSLAYSMIRNGSTLENADEISYYRNRITISLIASL